MSPDTVITILGMALVTYAIRAGGFVIAERLPSTGFVALWLRNIPGDVLGALVAPAVINGGPAEWIASAAAPLAFAVSRNIFATIIVGVIAVYFARQYV